MSSGNLVSLGNRETVDFNKTRATNELIQSNDRHYSQHRSTRMLVMASLPNQAEICSNDTRFPYRYFLCLALDRIGSHELDCDRHNTNRANKQDHCSAFVRRDLEILVYPFTCMEKPRCSERSQDIRNNPRARICLHGELWSFGRRLEHCLSRRHHLGYAYCNDPDSCPRSGEGPEKQLEHGTSDFLSNGFSGSTWRFQLRRSLLRLWIAEGSH